MGQPAHDQFISAEQLHAVDAEIHALFFGAAGNHQGPGHQRADVAGPAGLDRQSCQVDVFPT